MMPASTRVLIVVAVLMTGLWLWSWVMLDWTLTMPVNAVGGVHESVPSPALSEGGTPPPIPIDSTPLLKQPAFFSDRRAHPYRPDAEETTIAPKATLDFIVTSTIVGRHKSFAMLRLPGGANTVIARVGEPFEGDPSWRVTAVERTTVSFINAFGTALTLNVPPPAPHAPLATLASTGNSTMAPPLSAPTQGDTERAMQAPAPAAAVQPIQENADLRARIEARRKEALDGATHAARTQ